MPYIINKKTKEQADIFYEDFGAGQPVILIHGWPLSHQAWEPLVPEIVEAGFRCIAYDRRGFGKSSATWDCYDYSSLASDLNEIISQLNLSKVVICGFSMGGGEVVRYFTDFGAEKISKAILINSIIPIVKQKSDNPAGVPEEIIMQILDAVKNNRINFLPDFHKNFYNNSVSEHQLKFDWNVASQASPRATLKCAEAWAHTDFRPELKNVKVPTLIIHGDADNIVPIDTAGKQAAAGIPNNKFVVVAGAPHGITATHAKEVSQHVLEFLKS
jgi:non-heme chloroperoxidase